MKKTLLSTITALLVAGSVTCAQEAAPKLDVSVQQWYKSGSFDYYLRYPASPDPLSKVSAPQNRHMTMFKVQYNPDPTWFVRAEYGVTGTGNNGRGDDSDWMDDVDPDLVTDYGTMDFYGKERMYTIDIGQRIGHGRKHATHFFVGWESNKTANELRNVVYHLIDGSPVGNRGQADLGSRLDGHFYGARLGIENNYRFDQKLSMDTSLVYRRLTAKAFGHWANHSPAWNWVDRGKTWGYTVKTGFSYAFTQDTSVSLGYRYSYAKANGADEVLDRVTDILYIPGDIDLRYVQRGYYFSFAHKF
ncbi:MAG: hypothetical protein E6X17_16105 [Sporomusaceae bacterium]|nr:hypothetical protein [Sporomusaceae bacterium]